MKPVQFPKTKMTAEEVAADKALRNADKAPQVNRDVSALEMLAWKAHNTLSFKTGRLKK